MNSEKSSCLLLLFLDISNDVYKDCICVYMYVLTHDMHYLAIVLLPLYMYTLIKANIHDFFERHIESPEQNTAFCSLCLHKCSLLIKSLRGIAVCEKFFPRGDSRGYPEKCSPFGAKCMGIRRSTIFSY